MDGEIPTLIFYVRTLSYVSNFKSNNFINQKNRTKAKVKYYPLVYFLFYIKKSDAVSPEIGL